MLCLKASWNRVQLRQAPHSMTFRLYALPNRYRHSSLCPLTLLVACAAIAVAYRYEWVIPEYNGTWDNALYTDLKASDRGPHDLLTSSLTEEQSVLRPSFSNILLATMACSPRRRMVWRLVNDEFKEMRVNWIWCLGSIVEWLRKGAKDVSPCSDRVFPTFCSQQWPVAHGVEWCGGWWTMNLTLRRLMSYIYGAPILDVSRSHTTTHHSR